MLNRLALAGVQPLKKIHEHCDFSMGCFSCPRLYQNSRIPVDLHKSLATIFKAGIFLRVPAPLGVAGPQGS